MNSKLILSFTSLVVLIALTSGCTTENSDNGSSDEAWLNNYSPAHAVGSGDNDFWTFSPSENGLAVDHLPWIVGSYEDGCVLFVVHKTGCVGCQAQADRVIELADKVFSTSGMCEYAKESEAGEIIVGTEVGLLYKLRKDNPGKKFYPATELAVCPNMKLTTLEKVLWALEDMKYEVKVPGNIRVKAIRAVDKMLEIK